MGLIAAMRRWWASPPRVEVLPDTWAALGDRLPVLRRYAVEDRQRLLVLAERFLRDKRFFGRAGLAVTPEMQALVALQACVPILRLGLAWYDDWTSIILYPDEFLAEHEYEDEAGVVHAVTRPLTGEASEHGPVVLSWADSADTLEDWELNLVIHEFVHKLDMRNGVANGMPPLHRDMDPAAWSTFFQAAYDDFCDRLDHGLEVPFDDYAAEDPAEFFAVASEVFFMAPECLVESYPAVYEQLVQFYRQDPLAIGVRPPFSGDAVVR